MLWNSISRKGIIYNHILRDYANKSGPDVIFGGRSLKNVSKILHVHYSTTI